MHAGFNVFLSLMFWPPYTLGYLVLNKQIMAICSGTSTEWLFIHWNLDRFRIWKCWFLRRGENRSRYSGDNRTNKRKTSQSREEKQQQIQPTYCVESENRSRTTLMKGKCSHHCMIPAPRDFLRALESRVPNLENFSIVTLPTITNPSKQRNATYSCHAVVIPNAH